MVCAVYIAIFVFLSYPCTQLTFIQDMPPNRVSMLHLVTSCIIHRYMTCLLFHRVSSSQRGPLRTRINRSVIYISRFYAFCFFSISFHRLRTLQTLHTQIMLSTPLIAMKDPDRKVHGPTWGPSGADRTQVGPMLAPWTLLSGDIHFNHMSRQSN